MPSSNSTPALSGRPADEQAPEPVAARRPAGPWKRLPTWLRRTILFVALIGSWQLYTSVSGVSRFVFARPLDVARAFAESWVGGEMAISTLNTLRMLAAGMGIGIVLTLVLTVLAATTTIGADALTLVSSMINPLPSVAILPLAMLWFGLTDTALIFVTANAVLWPMTVNVSMGLRTTPATLVMVGRNLGLSGWRLTRDVMMPAALPHAIAGLKTGWAFGWRTIIAAELVFGAAGNNGGLGFFINNARYYARIPDVFAGLVTIALIGLALDLVFNLVERHTVTRWGMKEGTT